MSFQLSAFFFIGITIIAFYIALPGLKPGILAAVSLLFCLLIDRSAFVVLLSVTFFTYIIARVLGSLKGDKERKVVLCVSVFLLASILTLWKYMSGPEVSAIKIALPVGLSFYTFQAISYIADVYKRKYTAEKNIVKYILYMSWFPKLVSGPIERAETFLPQLDRLSDARLFDGQRIIKSLSYIIWGLFLKLMIADRAGIIVDGIFMKHDQHGKVMLITGSLLYTIQIYCDFAGYTDIMVGISYLFGIDLTQNFRTPYFAQNITEFWRSWHISLSSFLRDYVYIPLGGNRKGLIRKYINTMIVFFICGMWHGRGLKFIVWGLLHGIYSVLAGMLKDTKLSFAFRGAIGSVITFCCVSFAWIFFRAESLGMAIRYILAVFTSVPINQSFEYEIIKTGSTPLQMTILLIGIAVVFVADLAAYRRRTLVPEMFINTGEIRRNMGFLIFTVAFLIFGIYGNEDVKSFIYMNF